MKCPKCVKEGNKSSVEVGSITIGYVRFSLEGTDYEVPISDDFRLRNTTGKTIPAGTVVWFRGTCHATKLPFEVPPSTEPKREVDFETEILKALEGH